MSKELIKDYIKENLTVKIDTFGSWEGSGIKIQLLLEDELISRDMIYTKYTRD